MTGNTYLDLLISVGGVAVLVAFSFFLGGWRSLTLDEAAARDRLAFDEPDFTVKDLFIGTDGKTAAAVGNAGDIVLLFALGDGVATRRLDGRKAKIAVDGAAVVTTLNDPSKGKVKLAAPDANVAARWAGRLKGEAYN